MTLAVAALLDVTIVLALALAVSLTLRRRSASLRHALLAAALLAAAATPAIELLVPAWELPISWEAPAQDVSSTLTLTSSAATDAAASSTVVPATSAISWVDAFRAAWMLGAVVIFTGLLTGLVRLVRETRRCTLIQSGPWRELADALSRQYALPRAVTLLQSDHPSLLLTWGLFRPKVLLPSGADAWSAERRAVVLAHELAHIRRGDWALQLAAEALRAIYWFNPLVWIACRRLRHESEYACDDAVLDAGVEPTDYAAHLLDVARQAVAYRDTWASAPAIANPSTLERRISAMLSHTRNREPLTRRARACAVAAALIVAVPIASASANASADRAVAASALEPVMQSAGVDVTLGSSGPVAPVATIAPPPARPISARERSAAAAPPAQPAPGSVSGVMRDPSGGVLPGVRMTLTDATGIRYSRVTDGTGSFRFPDLPPGRYAMTAELPGFATVSIDLTLAAGENLQRSLEMRIGMLQERILVVCAAGGAALPAAAGRVMAFDRRAATTRLFPSTSLEARAPSQDAPRPTSLAAQDQPATGRQPVRVGGVIRAPQKIKDVNPICPQGLPPTAASTVVTLEATIGTDGFVKDVRPLAVKQGGEPPAELVDSAADAVRQWQYTPTLLNNVAVPVIVSVTVEYGRR